MMSAEMMRAAADMMSKMRPEDVDAIRRQMQSLPPDQLQRMMSGVGAGGAGMGMPSPAVAAEVMRNMRPEDMQFMARQMQNLPPEQLQRMMPGGEGAGGAAPSAYPAMVQMQQRQRYELDCATTLKEEGNKLHGAGKFDKAAEKYSRARDNLASHSLPEAAAVRKACTLNLMSCSLKLGRFQEVVQLGDEIVAEDSGNIKALYRRGQASMKLGQHKAAVKDLKEAARLAPGDDTLAGSLREAEASLKKAEAEQSSSMEGQGSRAGSSSMGRGEGTSSSREAEAAGKAVPSVGGVTIEDVTEEESESQSLRSEAASEPRSSASSTSVTPDAIRNIQMLRSIPPEQVAAMSGGSISPEMASMAARMVSSMAPEELQRMMELSQRFAGAAAGGAPTSPLVGGPSGGATSQSQGATYQSQGAARPGRQSEDVAGREEGGREGTQGGARERGFAASSGSMLPFTGLPDGANPMEDPKMMKMMAEMMKNLAPEDLASMSRQMGMPMSVEQAQQTKQLMDQVGPDNLAVVMKWTNRAQGLWIQMKRTLLWLLRQRALLLAIVVLVVAVVGRWLGYF